MKRIFSLLVALVLAGCASGPRLDTSFDAKSQDSRVRYLILHYTAIDSPTSLRVLTQQAVSSHYLVDDGEDFKIYRLVDESRRAYHAGVSSWRGNTTLNPSSIGIEIVNLGFRDSPAGRQWFPFPQGQVDKVIELVRDIVKRHDISPDRVLGHSDIAPQRKQDPGPLFPWKQLAAAGLAVWPDEAEAVRRLGGFEQQLPDAVWLQDRLAQHGYGIVKTGVLDEQTRNVVAAFQMRFRPAKFDGVLDAHTAALLDVLTQPVLPAAPPAASVPPASAAAPLPAAIPPAAAPMLQKQ